MTDREHLAAMRRLGARWSNGRLPSYPATMSAEQMREADGHYDAMTAAFVDSQCGQQVSALRPLVEERRQ